MLYISYKTRSVTDNEKFKANIKYLVSVMLGYNRGGNKEVETIAVYEADATPHYLIMSLSVMMKNCHCIGHYKKYC